MHDYAVFLEAKVMCFWMGLTSLFLLMCTASVWKIIDSALLCSTKLGAYSIAVTALSPSELITRAFSKSSACATQTAEVVRYCTQYMWPPAEPAFRFLILS
ncbi:Uncharacterized protein TCM_043325 [Theobroma cacao]|uniref:Uncharacterized protein n=1 Tax=Theobroma cacao TaxID=3641 RepID=A0A061FND8_THECC|nr:Uncharacterized protein TCM_043325 [Theobroma cacao]